MAEPGALFDVGAVILTGGKSSRMKRNKAFLPLGNSTFLERLLEELDDFPEVLISAAPGETGLYDSFNRPVLEDFYTGRGPIGGLYTALVRCRSSRLLALGCDKPLFQGELGKFLAERACSGGYEALVLRTTDGRLHPLCAIYTASCAEVFQKQILAGNNRLTDALRHLRTGYIRLADTPFSDLLLSNINTPQEYRALTAAPLFAGV
ncbi:MAG: molybdenum cofactor guanylyltransferase [Treponema sp.]|jgi:molybdopterin-guanine dinucleotide biosynthesis protein A|nr:molybdenum cofactor guanylyltransferase [Treponema sp.]